MDEACHVYIMALAHNVLARQFDPCGGSRMAHENKSVKQTCDSVSIFPIPKCCDNTKEITVPLIQHE
jgi:hypothetical protein